MVKNVYFGNKNLKGRRREKKKTRNFLWLCLHTHIIRGKILMFLAFPFKVLEICGCSLYINIKTECLLKFSTHTLNAFFTLLKHQINTDFMTEKFFQSNRLLCSICLRLTYIKISIWRRLKILQTACVQFVIVNEDKNKR